MYACRNPHVHTSRPLILVALNLSPGGTTGRRVGVEGSGVCGGGGGRCDNAVRTRASSLLPAALHRHSLTQGMVGDKVKQTEPGAAQFMCVLMCTCVFKGSVCVCSETVALKHYVGLCCNDVQWDSPPPPLCVWCQKEKSCAQMRTCMQHALERTKAHGTSALFNLTHAHTHTHTHTHTHSHTHSLTQRTWGRQQYVVSCQV